MSIKSPTVPLTATAQNSDISIRLESLEDNADIAQLCAEVFGPGANTRAAFALRENVPHRPDLAFVAERHGELIGTCRLTPVLWGQTPILMLGPLAVLKAYSSLGVGRTLMQRAINAADDAGDRIIFLVGDLAYYQPFGFERMPSTRISLPRPVDPQRVLVRECAIGDAEGCSGAVTRLV